MSRQSNPFEEGKLAVQSGLQLADNPYQSGSPEAAQWEEGFESTAEDDEDGEAPTRA